MRGDYKVCGLKERCTSLSSCGDILGKIKLIDYLLNYMISMRVEETIISRREK